MVTTLQATVSTRGKNAKFLSTVNTNTPRTTASTDTGYLIDFRSALVVAFMTKSVNSCHSSEDCI